MSYFKPELVPVIINSREILQAMWVRFTHFQEMMRNYPSNSETIHRFSWIPQNIKGVMTWAKVTSLVCRFRSLPWTNGPNSQFKWKLRYSPILCAYLKPSSMHFPDHRRTGIGICGKKPLAIAAMNVELPPFKNGEHNLESVSTIDRVITL